MSPSSFFEKGTYCKSGSHSDNNCNYTINCWLIECQIGKSGHYTCPGNFQAGCCFVNHLTVMHRENLYVVSARPRLVRPV